MLHETTPTRIPDPPEPALEHAMRVLYNELAHGGDSGEPRAAIQIEHCRKCSGLVIVSYIETDDGSGGYSASAFGPCGNPSICCDKVGGKVVLRVSR